MSDDTPAHTADELRFQADVCYDIAYESDQCERPKAANDFAKLASMLRAGADAMDDAKILEESRDYWLKAATEANALRDKAEARVKVLEDLINVPGTDDFMQAVKTEAAHQIERWGSEHDAGKTSADWFWLLGYLAGKAIASDKAGDTEKMKHHVITTAAACLNWHRAINGTHTDMRPGIMPPDEARAALGEKKP